MLMLANDLKLSRYNSVDNGNVKLAMLASWQLKHVNTHVC